MSGGQAQTAGARPSSRVWLPWAALGVVLVAVLTFVVVDSRPSRSPAARANRLAHELRCPTCAAEAVADSQAPAAVAIRADIKRRIAAGESDGEIRAAMVEHYTQYILLSPDNHGIGLIVWGAPIAALLLGGGGLALALRRWARQPRLVASAADEELVARARSEE
ncbi:MAG: cytochrome c-type biosis protein CcmH [Actinomycetota bacterium]|jgi:cytochrome c-type biogenesis protein CcmH|nr:cytochrome c-type biosis protein CcmH [Actinomycetota bacterium]